MVICIKREYFKLNTKIIIFFKFSKKNIVICWKLLFLNNFLSHASRVWGIDATDWLKPTDLKWNRQNYFTHYRMPKRKRNHTSTHTALWQTDILSQASATYSATERYTTHVAVPVCMCTFLQSLDLDSTNSRIFLDITIPLHDPINFLRSIRRGSMAPRFPCIDYFSGSLYGSHDCIIALLLTSVDSRAACTDVHIVL